MILIHQFSTWGSTTTYLVVSQFIEGLIFIAKYREDGACLDNLLVITRLLPNSSLVKCS